MVFVGMTTFLTMLATEETTPIKKTAAIRILRTSGICIRQMMISGTGSKSQSVMMCRFLVVRLTALLFKHLMVRGSETFATA